MQVAAFLIGEQIHVLQFPHVIDGVDAVLNAGRVSRHPASIVTAKKSIDIEADEVFLFLLRKKERSLHRLLPASKPRLQSVGHEFE